MLAQETRAKYNVQELLAEYPKYELLAHDTEILRDAIGDSMDIQPTKSILRKLFRIDNNNMDLLTYHYQLSTALLNENKALKDEISKMEAEHP